MWDNEQESFLFAFLPGDVIRGYTYNDPKHIFGKAYEFYEFSGDSCPGSPTRFKNDF